MNDKWDIIGDFYKRDKYEDKYSDYLNTKSLGLSDIEDILNSYSSSNMWSGYKDKKEETEQEKKTRLLREKAKLREAKIDLILKK